MVGWGAFGLKKGRHGVLAAFYIQKSAVFGDKATYEFKKGLVGVVLE